MPQRKGIDFTLTLVIVGVVLLMTALTVIAAGDVVTRWGGQQDESSRNTAIGHACKDLGNRINEQYCHQYANTNADNPCETILSFSRTGYTQVSDLGCNWLDAAKNNVNGLKDLLTQTEHGYEPLVQVQGQHYNCIAGSSLAATCPITPGPYTGTAGPVTVADAADDDSSNGGSETPRDSSPDEKPNPGNTGGGSCPPGMQCDVGGVHPDVYQKFNDTEKQPDAPVILYKKPFMGLEQISDNRLLLEESNPDTTDFDPESVRVQDGHVAVLYNEQDYEGDYFLTLTDDATTLDMSDDVSSVKVTGGESCELRLYQHALELGPDYEPELGAGGAVQFIVGFPVIIGDAIGDTMKGTGGQTLTCRTDCSCSSSKETAAKGCRNLGTLDMPKSGLFESGNWDNAASAAVVTGGPECSAALYDSNGHGGNNMTVAGVSNNLDFKSQDVSSVAVKSGVQTIDESKDLEPIDVVVVPHHFEGTGAAMNKIKTEVQAMMYGIDSNDGGWASKGPLRHVLNGGTRIKVHYIPPSEVDTPQLRNEPQEPFPCVGTPYPQACEDVPENVCGKVDSCTKTPSVGYTGTQDENACWSTNNEDQLCEDINYLNPAFDNPKQLCNQMDCTWRTEYENNLPEPKKECYSLMTHAQQVVSNSEYSGEVDLILGLSAKQYQHPFITSENKPLPLDTSGCGGTRNGVPVAAVALNDKHLFRNTRQTFYHEAGHALGLCHNKGLGGGSLTEGACYMDKTKKRTQSSCPNDKEADSASAIMNYCEPRGQFSHDETQYLTDLYLQNKWITSDEASFIHKQLGGQR